MKPVTFDRNWILAVDIGSSSMRGMVCDERGNAVAGTFIQRQYQFKHTLDGGSTLDPDALTVQVFSWIDDVLANVPDGTNISTVVIDTFVSNLFGVDEAGRPVTPLYTWSDARGGEVIAALKAQLPPPGYLQRTGCYIHPSYWPARLAWLRRSEPEMFGRAHYWLSIGTQLLWRVFGVRRTSISAASWSGLLNRHTLDWDAQTLDVLGISPAQLGEVSAEPFTGLAGEWAARWPQLQDAAWMPAIGDGVASNLGMGCNDPSCVALALGTSGAMRLLMHGTPDTIPDGLFCYRPDDTRSLLGGALSNVGNTYQWLRETLRLGPEAEVEALIGEMIPDGHGLTVLPFLAGERSPYWDVQLPAAVSGLSPATTPLDILRAQLEATAFGFWRIWKLLRPFAAPDARIIAGGGASNSSPAYMQILTDVLGQPISAAQDTQMTIRGAALFASGSQAGQLQSRLYTPDMDNHAVYAAAIARQEAMLTKFRP